MANLNISTESWEQWRRYKYGWMDAIDVDETLVVALGFQAFMELEMYDYLDRHKGETKEINKMWNLEP